MIQQRRVKNIIDRIVKGYKPQKIIMYGSRAKGNKAINIGSDLDLIIIKNTDEKFLDRIDKVLDCCKEPIGIGISLLVYTEEEIKKMLDEGNDFLETALREGVIMYMENKNIENKNAENKNSENKNLKEARRWLLQAKNDLAVAIHDKKGRFFANACFMAQQAGEKALKALCYLRGERQVVGHALLELLQRVSKYNEEIKKLEKECKRLDKYYIITRYPNGLPGLVPAEYFDEEEAEKAIEFASNILNWVEKKIANY